MRWLVALALMTSCSDREVVKLEAVKREVCSCPDIPCAEAAMKKVPKGDIKPTYKEQGVARDMLDCLAKLYDAAKPAAPATE